MTLTIDLQNQGQVDYCTTFFIVFDATDLAVIEICHLTSKDDLENQGQSYLLRNIFKKFGRGGKNPGEGRYPPLPPPWASEGGFLPWASEG